MKRSSGGYTPAQAFTMRWLLLGTGFGMLGGTLGILVPFLLSGQPSPDGLTDSLLAGLGMGVLLATLPAAWLTRTNRDGLNRDGRPPADLPAVEWKPA